MFDSQLYAMDILKKIMLIIVVVNIFFISGTFYVIQKSRNISTKNKRKDELDICQLIKNNRVLLFILLQ